MYEVKVLWMPEGKSPFMRRSPKALERERQVEALIHEANQAEDLSPADQMLRDLIEDPAAQVGRPPFKPAARRGAATAKEREPESDPAYEKGFRRVRALHREKNAQTFRHVLHDLFTEIARAGANGPLQPPDIILLDPVSTRYLCFNPDGTGRIVDSPDRERFEHLYGLLHGLDLARIRECGSCKRLFWARRKDKIACTRPCANRVRASKFYYKVKQRRMGKRPAR
jgi:hypothetical protein